MADVLYGLTDLSDPKSFVPLLVSPAGKVLIAGMPTQLGPATAANSMPVVLANGPLTDRSSTITTGGTAQSAMNANSSRAYCRLKNPDAAIEPLYYSFTGTATTASDILYPGDEVVSRTFCPTQALSVLGATTSHPYIAQEG